MKATLFGIGALALGSVAFAAPASALPVTSGLAGGTGIEQARVVARTVVRGPRCKTVTVKRRGPMGRVTVVRKRRCF